MGDRYEIVRRIADGGLGTVFEAYDHELKRNVALKRLKFSLLGANERDSESATQRLLEEATSMSSLNHPNIVSVYDAGHDENGSFMVMELLQGETLGETITRGTLTREDFEQLAAQTMDGLMAAEAASIVHCDLKPSNIMVVWQPSDRFLIKILDFGLAKVPQRPRRSATSQDSVLMGSIRFLAPEQIEKKEPTFLSDLYSMGCVYYYSLSGAYPFDGTSMVGVMQAHLNNQVRPLSELRPDLPIEVATWVMRLLNRAPNQRPQSARDALESFPFEHGTHQPYFTPPRQPTPQEVTEAPMLMPEPEPPRSLPAAPQFSGPVQDAYPIIVAESAPTTAPAWSSPRKISSFASRYLIGLATVCAIFFLALVSAFVWRNPLPQGPAATASPDITALTSEESSVPEPIPPDSTPLSIASSREPAQELTREPILAPSPPRLLPPPIAADEIPTYVWQLRRAVPEDRQLLLTQVRTLEEDRLYLEIWDALFIQEGIASDFELAQDIVEVRPPSRRSQDASLLMARIRTTEDMAKRSFLLRVLCRYPSLSEEVMVQLLDKGWKSEDLAHLEARLITHWRMRPIEGRDKALLGRLSQAQDMSYHSLSRVAGAVGGDAIFRHLEGHLGSPDPNEQRDALSALAHWRNRAPLPLIQDYLNTSPEDDLRQLATHAFLRLLAHPEPSLGEGWSTVLPYLQTKKEQNRFL
ncbi:MAG: protein kinase, partial [Verrucomicrobiota bacterium]